MLRVCASMGSHFMAKWGNLNLTPGKSKIPTNTINFLTNVQLLHTYYVQGCHQISGSKLWNLATQFLIISTLALGHRYMLQSESGQILV